MHDARDSVEVNRVVDLLFVGSTTLFAAFVDDKDYAVSAATDSVVPSSSVHGVSVKCIHHQLEAVDISDQKRSSIHRDYRKPNPGRRQKTGAQVSLLCQPRVKISMICYWKLTHVSKCYLRSVVVVTEGDHHEIISPQGMDLYNSRIGKL